MADQHAARQEAVKNTDDNAPGDTTTQEPVVHQNPVFAAGEAIPTGEFHQPTAEEVTQRNKRNLAIAGSIVLFMVIIFLITILRLGANIS
ncbi:MAG: hypothetical protein ACWA5L_00120 [bacterium]